jgi:hypothetical protein
MAFRDTDIIEKKRIITFRLKMQKTCAAGRTGVVATYHSSLLKKAFSQRRTTFLSLRRFN